MLYLVRATTAVGFCRIEFKPGMFAGQTVCVPPGTYMATEDININNDGVNLYAPSSASIIYRNSVQFFIRGAGNIVQNLQVNCQSTPYSGFVILGSNNHITGSSVRL